MVQPILGAPFASPTSNSSPQTTRPSHEENEYQPTPAESQSELEQFTDAHDIGTGTGIGNPDQTRFAQHQHPTSTGAHGFGTVDTQRTVVHPHADSDFSPVRPHTTSNNLATGPLPNNRASVSSDYSSTPAMAHPHPGTNATVMGSDMGDGTGYSDGMEPVTPGQVGDHALQDEVDVNGEGAHHASLAKGRQADNTRPAGEAGGPELEKEGEKRPGAGEGGAASGGSGGPGGKPHLEKFAYGFWAPEMKTFRILALKILGPTILLMIVVIWACLPLYWGSLWKSNRYTNKLTVRVIDRDGGAIGQAISQGLLSQTNLRYFATSPTEFPTEADVINDIVQEGAWGAIVISAGATDALALARSIGNATYNGSSAIHAYYSQARQEQATGNYLVPYVQQALGSITGRYSTQSAAMYLHTNAGNVTAINALAQAPSTISNSVFYTLVNVRPYNQPVANVITLVGLIYMVILAFIITMTGNAVREIISPFMTTRSYILYRLIVPMILYLPVSFLFAMISLPFKVHFGAHFNYAAGFFLWAFTLYLGMASVGLATEFAITILGVKFMAFFLIPLIIVNVSVAVLPHELQPWIYRYGLAMPFYNVGRVVRTIIFDTKNEIGMNLGILLGWIGLSFITIPLATWLARRKSVNAHRASQKDKMTEKNLTATPSHSNSV